MLPSLHVQVTGSCRSRSFSHQPALGCTDPGHSLHPSLNSLCFLESASLLAPASPRKVAAFPVYPTLSGSPLTEPTFNKCGPPPPPTILKDCMPTAPPTYPEFGPVTRVNWTFLLTCRRIWQPNFRICSGSELFPQPRGHCQVPSPCILKGSRLWCGFLTSHAHTKISQRFAAPLSPKKLKNVFKIIIK